MDNDTLLEQGSLIFLEQWISSRRSSPISFYLDVKIKAHLSSKYRINQLPKQPLEFQSILGFIYCFVGLSVMNYLEESYVERFVKWMRSGFGSLCIMIYETNYSHAYAFLWNTSHSNHSSLLSRSSSWWWHFHWLNRTKEYKIHLILKSILHVKTVIICLGNLYKKFL